MENMELSLVLVVANGRSLCHRQKQRRDSPVSSLWQQSVPGQEDRHTKSRRTRCSSCVRVEGVQGVLTLFCGGVAQTVHDARVVEFKEQLVVEELDGERQEEQV